MGLRGQAHITVAHLGRQMPDISTFEQISQTCVPFEISFEGVSIFRNQRTTHLVLPVAMGNAEMKLMYAKLRKTGKSPDRVFNAHMTVATVPTDAAGESVAYRKMLGFREKFKSQKWGNMVVDSFKLFTSTKGIVKVTDSWRLSGTEEVM